MDTLIWDRIDLEASKLRLNGSIRSLFAETIMDKDWIKIIL